MGEKNTATGCGICFLLFALAAFFVMGGNFYFFPFIPMFPVIFIFVIFIIVIASISSAKSKKNTQKPYQQHYPYYYHREIPRINPYEVRKSVPIQEEIYISENKPIVQPEQDTEKQVIRYCRFCGEKIEKDAIFCHQCGTRLK